MLLKSTTSFSENLRKISKSSRCNAEDLYWASIQMIKIAQAKNPPREALVEKLGIVRDENGTLKCGRRFDNINLPELFYLPNNTVTALFIMHMHNCSHHAGVAQTLTEIRRSCWIH